jgi:hypothetical protein
MVLPAREQESHNSYLSMSCYLFSSELLFKEKTMSIEPAKKTSARGGLVPEMQIKMTGDY